MVAVEKERYRNMNKFITIKDVCEITGYKQSSIYQKVSEKTFPSPHKIGRNNRWLLSDVQEWIQSIINKKHQGVTQ